MATEDIHIPIGKALALSTAERTLERLGMPDVAERRVVLDLTSCQTVHPFAGSYLGCGLRQLREREQLTVLVPNLDSNEFGGKWFRPFTRSGLGRALANNASSVISSRDDVTQKLRAYYAERNVLQGEMLLDVADFHSTRTIATHDFDAFLRQFKAWLGRRKFPGLEKPSQEAAIRSVARFLFQAAQNVVDHAESLVGGGKTSARSRLSVCYYKTVSATAGVGHLADYLKAVREQGSNIHGYVAIEVVDDGVGIPARQSQDAGIYHGGSANELQALQEALKDGGSVKSRLGESMWSGDPGYGLYHIRESLRELKAYGAIRTGRFVAEYLAVGQDKGSFGVDDRTLAYLPGTALFFLLPVYDAQMRLFSE